MQEAIDKEIAKLPAGMVADPAECSFQFDPIGKNKFDSTSCDIAKSYLAKAGVSYKREDAPAGTLAQIRSGETTLTAPDPKAVKGAERKAAITAFQGKAKAALNTNPQSRQTRESGTPIPGRDGSGNGR